VNFGNQHVGGNSTVALSVGNSGAADGFTEKLDAAFGTTTGSLTAIGSFKTLAAGQTNASSLTLKLSSGHDGAQSGVTTLTLKSDGSGIDTLGTTALTTQTITATGTFYNYATASTAAPNPVNFGKHHVGDVLTQTLSIINTGTVDGFTENLDGSIGGVTGSVTASGSFTGLAASKSDTSDLTVGLATSHDGVRSGTAILGLRSDGTAIDSLGTTALTSQTIAATGTLYNYATASVATPGTVSFGERHVGDALLAGLSIGNLGTADGFTENLDVTYGATTGAGLASTPVSAIGAGNFKAVGVGLASTHDGLQGGSVALVFSSDGTGIDNLGTTLLTSQTIAATGTLYNYATAVTSTLVNFGNHHVGDTLTRTLTVTNTGTADGFTEALNASLGGGTGGATGSGAFTGLGASMSNAGTVTIGLAATADGAHSGTATLSLTSNGSGIDTLGTKALTAQTITAAATLYALAAPVLSTTTLDFGAYRLGGTVPTRSLTIANGTTADTFQENLSYGFHSPSNGFALTSVAGGLIVAGGTHATASWTVAASVSGLLTTSTDLLDFTSVGAGTSGLANTALTSTRIALLAKVYAPAVAQLSVSAINFGVVHTGDIVSSGDTITNVVVGSLTDVLTGGVGAVTGAAFSGSGTLGGGLASGASATLSFALNTGTSGVFSGSAALALKTHDADLADAAVSAGPVTLSGTVDNYATAAIEEVSGGGSFTHSGSVYTLNLGAVVVGSTAPTIDLGVLNAANGLADLLSGSFDVSGSGFINTGFTAFSGEAAGQADTAPTLSLSTSQVGTFTESVTLLATGSNSSGYSAALHQEVLTVTGVVTAQPRTLIWTGNSSTDFADAGNWNDTTSAKNPATSAPGSADTAQFGGGGGAITGTGVASALAFGGNGTWNLASGAVLTAVGSVTVGSALPAELLIGAGSSIVQTGTGTAVIADQPTAGGSSVGVSGAGASWRIAGALDVGQRASGSLNITTSGTVITTTAASIANTASAAGSSVNVSGIGSTWQVTGALDVGNAAAASLGITDGATVTAASLDAGVLANSSGVIAVAGSNAVLTTTGSLSIGDAGSGELSILNGATVAIGGDLDIGQVTGGSGNVDIENATLTVAGNLQLGAGGPGVLTVGPTASVSVAGGIVGGAGGVLNQFAAIDPSFDDGETTNIESSFTQDYPAYVDGGAYFSLIQGVTFTLETPAIFGGSTFSIGSRKDTQASTLVLNAGSVSADSEVMFNNKLDTLVIGLDTLGTIDTQTSDQAAATLVANPDLGSPLLGHFDATIAGFKAGDKIEVQTTQAAQISYTAGNDFLDVVLASDTLVSLGTLAFDTAANAAAAFTSSDVLVDNALCFLAGTLIGTPEGQVEVERLAAGDLVRTASGVVRPVVWVGHGRVLATRGRRGPATPVIVRKGALGPNMPHTDLRVTKGHSLFVDGLLIPVEFLVNHRSILWDDRAQEVSVYHVELETHDVLVANGAAAESYRDDGNRWLFGNANAGWDLPPQTPCAPVLTGGPAVDAVWRRLLDACGKRPSVPLTEDADVHLLVDGVRVDGVRTGDVYVFPVQRPDAVRLMSRAAVPQELGLARDARLLGVALRRVVVRLGTRFRVVRAGDPLLAEGFHAFEPGTGLRWTDGDAMLPAAMFTGFDGACEVVVHLGGTATYVDDGDVAAVA
jgi:T5SS/PEP-CTERM-associated repeat protein